MSSNPSDTSFLSIAVRIFLVLNATGQIPLFLAMLGRFSPARQRAIILREMGVALALLLAFTFIGDVILGAIGITREIIGIAGGILLFLISLAMIFPKNGKGAEESPEQEPFIIPLAIPVITGPGAIAAVMTFAYETDNPWLVAGSALCAWLPSLFILLLGPYIKGILGTKGLVAVERLGGMLVCLIGINMFTEGLLSLIKNYYHL